MNCEAVNAPVEGVYLSLLDDTNSAVKLPLVLLENSG